MRIPAALLFFVSAGALAAPTEITAEYRLTNSGVTIGRVTESYVRKGDTYSIQSITRSEGVLKIFLDDQLTAESSGRVNARGLQPLEYVQRRQNDSSRDIRATFDWAKGLMHSRYRGEGTSVPLPRDTQDRLSLMYQFMNIAPREGNVVMPMSNGRKVEFYTYRLVEEVRLATPAGDFQTFHFERVTTGERESKAHVWLAKDRFNFPVRIVFDDAKGLKVEQMLVALETR